MPNEFNEPWTAEPVRNVMYAEKYGWLTLVDTTGESVLEVVEDYGSADAIVEKSEFARRIVACVNFCRGMPTELLESWHRIQHEPIGAPSDG